MDRATRSALGDLNRRFYDATAQAFAATRGAPWAGWERVLGALPAADPLRVLDLGCGNGRFARFVAERGFALDYVGIDASEPLLAIARQACADLERATFAEADLVEADPEAVLPEGPFDAVVLFGLLHHVPGAAQRDALLRAALRRVAPGGLLAATFWQFGAQARFRDKTIPWSVAPQVDPERLEPGDLLLPWGQGEGPPRYCHFADADEVADVAQRLPAPCEAVFDADGKTDDLNRYVLWRVAP